MFFVTGTGRSGTQLLSDLLDKTGCVKVFHEPNFGEDVGAIEAFRNDEKLPVQY